MNALADPEVGQYLNEHFASSFQKVATFKIVNGQKQGGNVAAYFCAPDGRVVHVVAGPVDAATMLKEARWVVETTRRLMKDSAGDGGKFKALLRTAHADRLRREHGATVEPLTFDPDETRGDSALSYRDPSGRPLAPKLPPPPVDGPDVSLKLTADAAGKASEATPLVDRRGRRLTLPNQGRVHMLLAAYGMVKIETLYGVVFENILGERISTQPVDIVTPFPWIRER